MARNFCFKCGTPLNKGANYCPGCGTAVNESARGNFQSGFDDDNTNPAPPTTAYNDNRQAQPASPQTNLPRFRYPETERHSEIITTDDTNGEPIVKFRNLHPNAVWLFFFQYLGKSMILLLLFSIMIFFEPLLSGTVIIIYFIILFLIAKINFKNYEFEVTTTSFRKVYGVFHKYTVNIAFDQIQNINTRRSVIDQLLGLAHLEVETAGTGGKIKTSIGGLLTRAEGYIPGITPNEAQDVKKLMLARIQRNT